MLINQCAKGRELLNVENYIITQSFHIDSLIIALLLSSKSLILLQKQMLLKKRSMRSSLPH